MFDFPRPPHLSAHFRWAPCVRPSVFFSIRPGDDVQGQGPGLRPGASAGDLAALRPAPGRRAAGRGGGRVRGGDLEAAPRGSV